MTRGTLFLIDKDGLRYTSTEFNGDMYFGYDGEFYGHGVDVIKGMAKCQSKDDFEALVKMINEKFGYEEGDDIFSCDDEEIEAHFAWGARAGVYRGPEDLSVFNNVETWHYWGCPNLSDYSYILNLGKAYKMIDADGKHFVIKKGEFVVLNFGSLVNKSEYQALLEKEEK